AQKIQVVRHVVRMRDRSPVASDQLVPRVSEDLTELVVHLDEAPLWRGDGHTDQGQIEEAPKTRFVDTRKFLCTLPLFNFATQGFFCELLALDVDTDRIPPDNIPLLIAQGRAPGHVPSILSISATYAHFNVERFSSLECSAPCLVIAFGVVGMKMRESPGTCTRRLFQGQAHVLLPCSIDEGARTVGPISWDEHRDRVDRRLQVTLAIKERGLALRRRRSDTPPVASFLDQMADAPLKALDLLRSLFALRFYRRLLSKAASLAVHELH